ncbi:MAG: hypothetical protein KDJ43_11370, partial [Rhizobiaceae bacterium]|nr:hypothetical protein [Rhizobiaceae bacterium]
FAARRADRDPLANPDEEIQRLTRLADEAELEGAFNAANSFRDQAKARVASLRSTRQTQIEQLRRRIIEDAEVYARSAETKTLIFRHAEAARDYAEARDIVAEWDAEKAIEYARNQIDALLTDAELRGASGSLGEAERTARALLETDMGPGDRATFGLRLARALSLSASGTGDSALFVEAAGRLETALGEAGNSDPSLRAGILLTLGLARGQLAFLSGDLTALADAESRFDAAAEEAHAAGDHALEAEAEFRAVQAMYYRWTDSPDVELFGRIQQRFLKLVDRIDDQDIDPQAARYLSRVSEIGFDLAMRQNTPDALRQAAEMNDAVAGMFDADRYPIVAAQLRSLDALIGMRLAQRFGDTAQLESALNNVDAALATFSEAELPAPTRDTRWQKILLLITMGTRENETVHLESARQEIAILQAGFPDMTAEQVRLIEFQSARIDAAIAVREGDTELLESAVGELSRIHGSIDRAAELPIYTEVGEELGKARSWLFGLTGEGIEQTVATLRETVEQYEAWGGAAASAVPFAELSQYYATATANYAMETGAAADIEAAVEANIAIRDQLAALGDGIGAANAANTAAYMLVQSLRKDFDADTFRRARALSDEALAKLDAAPQFAGYFNNTACELDTEKARADDDADLARAALAQCRAALATLETNGQSDAIPTARASVARAERLVEDIGG